MSIIEAHERLLCSRISKESARLVRATLEKDEEEAKKAVTMLMELKGIDSDTVTPLHNAVLKKYKKLGERDFRDGDYGVRWLYGKYKPIFSFIETIPRRNVIVREYGCVGEQMSGPYDMTIPVRVVKSTGEIKRINDQLETFGNCKKMSATRIDLILKGYYLLYKIDVPEGRTCVGKALGYVLTKLDTDGKYECTLYMNSNVINELDFKYASLVEHVKKNIKTNVGELNNKQIKFV